MVLTGRIENGVVILTEPVAVPDGALVTVIVPPTAASPDAKHRVQLPLVPSKNPGSLHLSADDIARLLSQDGPSP